MALIDKKVAESEYTGHDITGLSNTPSKDGIDATSLKSRFDSIAKTVLIPKYNALIDMLVSVVTGSSGARSIGFEPSTKIPKTNVFDAIDSTYDMASLKTDKSYVDSQDLLKVDKVTGKSLLSDSEIERLKTLANVDGTGSLVSSVAGRIGNVILAKSDVGLSNIDNTSDLNKPVSTAQQVALGEKQPTILDVIFLKPSGVDDTAIINSAILNYKKIVLTSGVYLIDAITKVMFCHLTNRQLVFLPGAIMQVITNNSTIYSCISIFESIGITIDNPTVIGDWSTHQGTTGEWGHGIDILNSDNIIVNNPNCSNLWGDGIYIGVSYAGGTLQSGRVIVNNPIIDLCRRNGISVCSGKYIEINSALITNINGTFPKSGIDIEPEGGSFVIPILEKVVINNLTTKSCYAGITLNLGGLDDRSLKTDIVINNHIDRGSANGLLTYPIAGVLDGSIVINNSNYLENGSNGFTILYPTVNSPKITLNKPVVKNCNQFNFLLGENSNGISIFGASTATSITSAMGNVDIINPIIIDTNTIPKMTRAIFISNSNPTVSYAIQKINVIDPLDISYGTNRQNFQAIPTGVQVLDRLDKLKCIENYFEWGVGSYAFYKTFTNELMSGGVTYTLDGSYPENVEVTFRVNNPYLVTIIASGTQNILPLFGMIGKTISSSIVGASVTLKRVGLNWLIINIVGLWNYPTWTAITPLNGWSNVVGTSLKARVLPNGDIQIVGQLSGTTRTNGTVIGTLPVGIRPSLTKSVAQSTGTPVNYTLWISTTGEISIYGATAGDIMINAILING